MTGHRCYANGKLLGRLDRRRGENSLKLPALTAGTRLDILIEAMGRVNFDKAIHDRKGITEKVELLNEGSTQELKNWQVYSFPAGLPVRKRQKIRSGQETGRTGLLPCDVQPGRNRRCIPQYADLGKRHGLGKRKGYGPLLENRSAANAFHAGLLAEEG